MKVKRYETPMRKLLRRSALRYWKWIAAEKAKNPLYPLSVHAVGDKS